MKILICTIAVGAWFGQCAAGPLNDAASRMNGANVIICVIDAATTHHMSCYGYTRKTTPVIDELAGRGVFFKNAFSQACYTVCSTGCLMTGLYPERHAMFGAGAPLPDSFTTMAEIMKANGFTTAMFSGNGFANGDYGYAQGFDHYDNIYRDFRPKAATPWLNAGEANLREKVAAWLGENRKARIFAYIHIIPPHENYEPPARFRGKWAKDYKGAPKTNAVTLMAMQQGKLPYTERDRQYVSDCYDDNMIYADYNVGLVIERLKKLGIWDTTLFILLSDHGEAFAEHGDFLHNTTLYDEMIHIPMIFKFPKSVAMQPKTIDGLAQSLDILPTITDLCGIATPAVDGASLVPLISGEKSEIHAYTCARTAHGLLTILSVRDRHYKYIYNIRTDKRELYDLQSDPGEKTNIAESKPLVARYMHSLLKDRIAYYQAKSAENAEKAKPAGSQTPK